MLPEAIFWDYLYCAHWEEEQATYLGIYAYGIFTKHYYSQKQTHEDSLQIEFVQNNYSSQNIIRLIQKHFSNRETFLFNQLIDIVYS